MSLQEILTSAVLVFLLVQNLILMLIWWQGRQQPVAATVPALPTGMPQQPVAETAPTVQVDTAPEYAPAIQALRRGADPRQVSQEFGITHSEADLLRHLHP